MGLSLCVECYLVVARGKNARCVARNAVNGLSGSKNSELKDGFFFTMCFLLNQSPELKQNCVKQGFL